MSRYQFTLTGTSPLLMHADNITFADELQEWRKDPKNKSLSKPGDDRSPAWTWLGGLYCDDKCVAMPADNLAVAIRQAGAKMILKGNKTYKEEAVAGLFIEEEFLPLETPNGTISAAKVMALRDVPEFPTHLKAAERLGFSLFVKRAAVGTSKHVRVRPRFDHWTLRGTISVDSEALKPDILTQLFHLAGRVGVGSWRPGGKTPGRFGMFGAELKPTK